jgi:hypothetical protein
MLEHSVEIIQHVSGWDAQDANALARQPLISNRVSGRPVTSVVRFTVDLDRKVCCGAEKVEHIRAGGVLASIANTIRFLSELLPEEDFRQAHSSPELSRQPLVAA